MRNKKANDIRPKARKVLSSMGVKQKQFRPENYYSSEELRKIGDMYRLSNESLGAKKRLSDAIAKTEIEGVSDNLEHRVEDVAFFLKKKPRKGQKVLDIASGSTLTPMVAGKLTKAEYHAVDISREMLLQSEKLGKSSVNKVQGVAENLPYKSGVFNEVWLENPDRLEGVAIKEAHRVLKNGGVFKVVARVNQVVDKKAFGKIFKNAGFYVEVNQSGPLVTVTAKKK